MRRAVAVFAIIATCLLASCGGSEEPKSPAVADTSASAGEAGASDDTEAADPCTTLSAEDVGAVLGGPVTLEEAPGGGCGFDQDDPRAPSVGIFAVSGAGGGFEASKGGNTLAGQIEDVPGVADGAWLAVGTSGGENIQGQGVVARGDQLVNIALTQGNGLDEAAVRDMVLGVLKLVDSAN